ncbi:RHS repeat-associated core domain-containing protein [Nocardia vinacea]|uniref:DUF6531 domain-containing protein n=1 Tax=Nocardia vinacea TaxID=96468 RepID=UPI00343DA07C
MTETSSNPLIAQRADSTQWYSGVSVFETVSDLHSAITSGSWIDGGLGVLGVGMEAVSLVIDPIGTIASYGVGFLIEHVKPLSDVLDWVAGDPDQIEAYAKTWENVATSIAETSETHKQAVEQDVAGWTGSTADAYKKSAADTSSLLSAASTAAKAASDAVRMAGGIVAAVRMVVRDLVAQAVGRLAAWAAEEVFSFGVATPLVAAQAATFVAKTMTTIANLFRKLARTFAKLMPLLKRLKSVFADIAKGFKRTKSGRSAETPHGSRPKSTEDTSTKPSSTTPETKPTETSPKQTDSSETSTNPSQHNTPEGEKPNSPSKNADKDKDAPDKAREDNPEQTKTPKDTTTCGDPVDAATGEFWLPATDVDLPGVLRLMLGRRHRSNYRFGRWFGPSWSATLDMRIIIDQAGVTFICEDGMLLAYPHTAPEVPVPPSGGGPRWMMTRSESGGYRVFDPDREITWHFAPDPVLNGLDVRLGNYAISAITDRHNNRIQFHYNADGAPAEVTHSGGYRVRVYTADGRVTGLSVLGADSDGGEISTPVREFGYMAGQLVSTTNGVDAGTTYTYDGEHRILSWTDSNGNQLVNTYDFVGRVVSQRGTNGMLSAEFEYTVLPDGSGTRTVFTNSLGARTIYEFDAAQQLRDVIDPTGARTHTDYNSDRRPVRVVAADGAITFYHYALDGDLTKVTRPDQKTITIDYQAHNRPTTIVEADGSISRREYDSHGNLVAVVDAGGVRTTYTHRPFGAIATVTESTGAQTIIESNPAGLPVVITDPYGAVTRINRDHFGRPIAITDPLGAVTRYRWSPQGKPLLRLDHDGGTEAWVWDGEGNLLSRTDRAGGVTRYTYGTFDLLTSRIDPDKTATRYTWDTERRLQAVINPLGRTWRYSYDAAGRVAVETDYTGAVTRYDYDPAGRIATLTPATGVRRHHTYDLLGRLVQIRADTAEWIRYTHDPVGHLSTALSGTGKNSTHTIEFTHTAAGHLATQRVDDRPPTRYQYDSHGRRVARTTPTGGTNHWRHDIAGRVAALTADGHTIGFTYDVASRPTGWQVGSITLDYALSMTGQVMHREVTESRTSATEANALGHGARLLRRDDYTWRSDGYLATHMLSHSGSDTILRDYTLDAVGRVTAITANSRPSERYTYDALGNITSSRSVGRDLSDSTVDPGAEATTSAVAAHSAVLDDSRREYRNNLLIRDGRTRYHYDESGRLIRKTITRPSRKPNIWHYRYNAFDQLIDVYTPDKQWWHYTYDALGRRTTKQHLANDGAVLERTDYAWDATHLTEQTSNGVTTRWQYQPGTFTPLTQVVDLDTVNREFYAIVTDLIGTPCELIDPITARTVGVTSTDLWGDTAWHGQASTPLRFPGQIHDPETGLHYNLHRVYDPTNGRFLTQDPLGLAPAPNPNTYPHNPTVWGDPLGLVPDSCAYRDFAHGTSRAHADDITDNGISAEASRENAKKGSMNRPSSFFTHEVEHGGSPGVQAAYEWGARIEGWQSSTVIIGRLPESTYQRLVDMGLVEVRKAGEGVPDETIFHPDSFEILNREMQWIAKFTPNG